MAHPNTGGLWHNQRKAKANDPDFIGIINIDGIDHKFVGWKSTSTNPQAPAVSLKVSDPRPVPMPCVQVDGASLEARVAAAIAKEKEDDIPF